MKTNDNKYLKVRVEPVFSDFVCPNCFNTSKIKSEEIKFVPKGSATDYVVTCPICETRTVSKININPEDLRNEIYFNLDYSDIITFRVSSLFGKEILIDKILRFNYDFNPKNEDELETIGEVLHQFYYQFNDKFKTQKENKMIIDFKKVLEIIKNYTSI